MDEHLQEQEINISKYQKESFNKEENKQMSPTNNQNQ